MEIVVRRLRESDIETLSRIEAETFSMPWSAADFASLIDRDYCLYLVAEVDGEVAGCCGLTNSFGDGNIDNVVVAEKYRNRGVGRRLLEELFIVGEKEGVTAYTLEVRVSNAAAIHLYRSCGFVSEGTRPGFYEKPVEDALIMWKRRDTF